MEESETKSVYSADTNILFETSEDILIEDLSCDARNKSTFVQTCLNSVNIVVGVGILSLPFALKHAGWVFGLFLLIYFMTISNYTAQLLAICLDYNVDENQMEIDNKDRVYSGDQELCQSLNQNQILSECNDIEANTIQQREQEQKRLQTYLDIGEAAFGQRGKNIIMVVFLFELMAAATALLILVADSFNTLFPQFDIRLIKVLSFFIMLPLTWLKNLKYLSYISIIGIFTIINLFVVIFYDGLTYKGSPGSLINPAETNIWPKNMLAVPAVFGLFLSCFSCHPVYPQIYREMKAPKQFSSMMNLTSIIVFGFYATLASVGYLMFGQYAEGVIIKNLYQIPGYNQILNTLTIWIVAINPMTKFPLTLQPVFKTAEQLLTNSFQLKVYRSIQGQSKEQIEITIFDRPMSAPLWLFRLILKTLCGLLSLSVALLFPQFDKMMSLLGSLFNSIVTIILPIAFYIKLFGTQMSPLNFYFNVFFLILGAVTGIIGTIWTFLPPSFYGF